MPEAVKEQTSAQDAEQQQPPTTEVKPKEPSAQANVKNKSKRDPVLISRMIAVKNQSFMSKDDKKLTSFD